MAINCQIVDIVSLVHNYHQTMHNGFVYFYLFFSTLVNAMLSASSIVSHRVPLDAKFKHHSVVQMFDGTQDIYYSFVDFQQ